jgi:hypothetical protein
METRFNAHFEDVRIHDDDRAHRSATESGSKAYAFGTDIVFGENRYAPHTAEGKQLLAHELAHVVQQRRGGDMPGEGTRPALEKAASAAANAVAAGAAQVPVVGASSVGIMHDKDDRRRRGGKRGSGDDGDGRDKKAERDRTKRETQERKQQRASAGKDDQQIREQRAEKKLRSLEKDAGAPGSKSRSLASKNKKLRNFEDVLKDAGGSQRNKNVRKGKMDELQRTPKDVAGNAQEKFVAGGREVPGQELRPGQEHYAQPDYSLYRRHPDGTAERLHVNLKSDKLYQQSPARARSTAKNNTAQAIRNSRHLPNGESIIISYAHTPDPEIQAIMLEEHFSSGSPISEVRFGTTTHSRSTYKPTAKPTASKGKAKTKKPAQKKGTKKAAKAKPKQKTQKKAQSKAKAKPKAKGKAKSAKRVKPKDGSKAQDKVQGKEKAGSKSTDTATKSGTEGSTAKVEKQAVADKPTTSTPKPDAKPAPSGTPPVNDAAPAKPVVEAKAVEPPKPPPITERGVVPEVGPKGRGPAIGPFEVLGVLGAIPAAKDIRNDIKEGHYGTATAKAALLRLSFVAEAAPPLFSAAVISTYWGERHEKIQEDSFAAGEAVEDLVERIPVVNKVPYLPKVMGALRAADVAVGESIAYTVKDMGEAIGEGAEDVYDWLTEPMVSDEEMKQILKQFE